MYYELETCILCRRDGFWRRRLYSFKEGKDVLPGLHLVGAVREQCALKTHPRPLPKGGGFGDEEVAVEQVASVGKDNVVDEPNPCTYMIFLPTKRSGNCLI